MARLARGQDRRAGLFLNFFEGDPGRQFDDLEPFVRNVYDSNIRKYP